jgi:isopentenyl phosphate kinase
MRPVVVKLGGSVITDKGRPFAVRRSALRRLARELVGAGQPLVVVHGGGSFGHPLASRYRLAEGYKGKRQLMGFSLTHRAMERLNADVVEALQRAGLPAVAVPPSACVVVSGGKIRSMELAPIRKLLELGIVPVLYGDAVPDMKMGMSILSGDQIVVHLARELGASRVILGADVDGVCTADPKEDRRASVVRRITPADRELIRSLGAAGGGDVTGGMARKVREMLALAEEGVEAEIVNAARPGILRRALRGERGLGTVISGERR